MPLNANFIADFSSFLDATKQSIAASEDFERAAGEIGPAFDKSLGSVGTTVEETNKQMLGWGKAIGGALASQELRNLAGDVKSFATTYIAEYAEAEAATARLTVALKNSGQASPAVTEAYSNMAGALQDISRFSDEAITDAQTLFTQIGNVTPDNMEATLKATMDLAAGMKMDLVDAANLVARAAQSDGEELGKLKRILGDSLEPGADYADVIQGIADKFGGQFAADLQTTEGSMENLKNSMSEVNELIGEVFANNLKTLLEWFKSMPEGVQTFVVAVVAIGTALAPILVSLASVVALLGATGLGAAIGAAVAFLAPFIGTIALVAAAVAALVAAFVYWDDIVVIVERVYNAIKKFLVDGLTWIVDQVAGLLGKVVAAFKWAADAISLHSIVPDMVDEISSQFGRLQGVMVRPAMSAIDTVTGGFSGLADTIKTIQPGTGAGLVAASKGAGTTNVTVNMSGMLGTDDPQTRALIRGVVSDALMPGMRGARLMGTA
jgi:hypothetical protein